MLDWLFVRVEGIDFCDTLFDFLRKGLKNVGLNVGMGLLEEFGNMAVVVNTDDVIDF